MFPWSRSQDEEERRNQAINEMFYCTSRNSNTKVCNLVKEYQFNLNSNECKDEYDNTLLHIVANGRNVRLAKQLIILGAQKYHKNVYGDKAVDIALKNNNLDMIKVLVDLEVDEYLQERIKALEKEREDLTIDLTNVKEELDSHKRKRCNECIVKERENKKMRTVNNKLTENNEKLVKNNSDLEKTVNNLRNSFKK